MKKLKRLIRAAAAGAAVQYFLDPAQGARRRALLRDRISFAKRRATAAVDTARPTVQHAAETVHHAAETVQHAAEVTKERVGGVVHSIRHRGDEGANGHTSIDITRDAVGQR
jgi:hypothetical protein